MVSSDVGVCVFHTYCGTGQGESQEICPVLTDCHTGRRATDLFFLCFSMKLRALVEFLHFLSCFP